MIKRLIKNGVLVILVSSVLAGGIYLVNLMYGTYTTHNIKNYLNDKYYSDFYAEQFMPKVNKLTDNDVVKFTYQRQNYKKGLTSNAYVLKVVYNDKLYKTVLTDLQDKYSCLRTDYLFNDTIISLCSDVNFDYPRSFGAIGLNDSKRTITYIFFFDEGNQNEDLIGLLNLFLPTPIFYKH